MYRTQNVSFEQIHVPVSAEFRRMYDDAVALWQEVRPADISAKNLNCFYFIGRGCSECQCTA